MRLSKTEIAFCELVGFVKTIIDTNNMLSDGSDGGKDSVLSPTAVFNMFKSDISPKAELILGNTVPKNALTYLQVTLDNVWNFAIDKPEFMIVSVHTDGSIDLDEGTAECLFNYVND